MDTKCEVIGWLLVDAQAQMLVREEGGGVSLQAANFESASIQTGVFRRGNPIIDPVTRQTLGYEMESVSSRFAGLA
jgi:hypothetical protein